MNSNYSIINAQNVKMQLPLASIGDRIVAFIIDRLAQAGYVFLIIALGVRDDLSNFLLLVPALLYSLLFEYFNNGITPGKAAFKLQVVPVQGGSLTFLMVFLRWVFRLIDFTLFTPLVAFIAVSVNESRQRIGDLVAETTVITNRISKADHGLELPSMEKEHQVQYPQVHELSETQIQTIRDVLYATHVENRTELINKLTVKVCHKLNLPEPEKPFLFLRTILEDYGYLKSSSD